MQETLRWRSITHRLAHVGVRCLARTALSACTEAAGLSRAVLHANRPDLSMRVNVAWSELSQKPAIRSAATEHKDGIH